MNTTLVAIIAFVIVVILILYLRPNKKNTEGYEDVTLNKNVPLENAFLRFVYPEPDEKTINYSPSGPSPQQIQTIGQINAQLDQQIKDLEIEAEIHQGLQEEINNGLLNNQNSLSNINIKQDPTLYSRRVPRPQTNDIPRDRNGNTCQNRSLNELHKTGRVPYKPNSVCGQLESNIQGDMNGMDPAAFYRDNFEPPVAYLNDQYEGWNYNVTQYDAHPSQIGMISLEKTSQFPQGAPSGST